MEINGTCVTTGLYVLGLKNSWLSKLLNTLQHQLAWFICVLGAAWKHATLAALLAIAVHTLHFLSLRDRNNQAKLAIACVLLGTCMDTLHSSLGIIQFNTTGDLFAHLKPLAPSWIITLWFGLSTILPYAFSWLSKRYFWASLLGCIGGPLSFLAGYRLGALQFPQGHTLALFSIACVWSISLPSLVYLTDRWIKSPRDPAYIS